MSAIDYINRLLFVHKCASCRQILPYNEFYNALCDECRLKYEMAKAESCHDCMRAACECTCQPKLLSNNGSLCLRKLFFYHTGKENEPQNRLVYFLKHNQSKRVASFVGRELWKLIDNELSQIDGIEVRRDVFLTNVPRGKAAVRREGFDQSELICKMISREIGMPYKPLILRKNGGKEQKKLTARERTGNIRSFIYVNERLAEEVKGKYVILLDDIVTTGASMSACLPLLRKMGIKGVICCSLAYDTNNKIRR